jgi:chemotaxis-related protein WspD
MTSANGKDGGDCWKRIGTWGDRSCVELKPQLHCRNCDVYSSGAARLLDAEVSAADLAQRAEHYAAPKAAERSGTVAVVIFRIATEWLALPASIWREVHARVPIHTLPHRRDQVVTGVVNIRGELLVCVSLAAALGVTESNGMPSTRLAVVQRAMDRFVFPADEVAGLHRYDPAELVPMPTTLARTQSGCTCGMIIWEERSVGLLDEDRVFQTLNRSLA